jgi:hypothetical protein
VTIQFPDVSHFQAGLSIAGAPALIAKASEGASFRDSSYVDFRTMASRRGIPFVGYHWVNTDDLAAQARNAHGAVGSTPLMWDAEASGATVSRIVDLTRRVRALGGNPRLVYLPHWWWQDHLGSPSLTPLIQAGLHLVSSQFTTYSDRGPGWRSYGGMTPVIWQFTESRQFNGRTVDFNAFKGTAADLAALLGTPIPGGDNDMTPQQSSELADCLNILTALANGLDSARVHDKDGVLSLTPLYRRIAQEVAKLPAAGALTDETGGATADAPR